MRLVDLPFVSGQDTKVDPKIAPLGVLKTLENGRIDRDGRIVKRPGLALGSLAKASGSVSNTQALLTRGDERVMIGDDAVLAWIPTHQRWKAWNPLPRVGVPERHAGLRNSDGNAKAPSIAYANGYVCVVGETQYTGGSSLIRAVIYDTATWTVRSEETLAQTTAVAPKVVACGSVFVTVWYDTSAVQLIRASYDTSLNNTTWNVQGTLVSNASLFFDLSPYGPSDFLFAYADNAVGQIKTVYFSLLTGVLDSKSVAVFGGTGACSITGTAGEGASVVWLDSTSVKIYSWQFSGGSPFGGSVSGPTTLNTNASNQGFPLVCRKSATVHTAAWVVNEASPPTGIGDATRFAEVTTASHVVGTTLDRLYVRAASKPTYLNGRLYFLGVNASTYDRTLFLLGHTAYSASGDGDETVETFMARAAARAYDTGRHVSELVTYVDTAGVTQILVAFPFLQAGSVTSATPFSAIDFATIPFGGSERHQSIQYGGLTYITGGLLSSFDGENAHEVGFLHAPRIISLTGSTSGGGNLTTLSTYRYLITVEWYDTQGGRHMSQLSDPVALALTGTQNQIRIDYHNGLLSNRRRMWLETSPVSQSLRTRIHIWRTAANGTIFNRITGDDGIDGYPQPNAIGNFLLDQLADTTIAANPVVYTQGVRGALSGPLEHQPPPPCKFISIGKARAIIGGLEQPDEVRFSKYFYPGEPLTWQDDLAFRRRVGGKVTVVRYLDDAAIVFTKNQIFAVYGEGPDDSGAGSFADPVVIPSETGCIDSRSVVETPLGLFFQGRSDRIFLLPRGGGSPIWVGEPVRDVLASNPVITAAVLIPEKSLVIFSCGSITGFTARTLVYDLHNGQWSVDTIKGGGNFQPFLNAVVWDGLLVYNFGTGYWIETTTFSDTGTWFGITIETHALRPHGLQAEGRTRKVAVLAEYRSLTDLDLSIAPDDAQNFTTLTLFTAAGLTAGDPVRFEWRLPTQKFGSVRLRVRERQNSTNNTAALRFNGLTFETEKRGGMPRLGLANRG
jgi:hypothetical protein